MTRRYLTLWTVLLIVVSACGTSGREPAAPAVTQGSAPTTTEPVVTKPPVPASPPTVGPSTRPPATTAPSDVRAGAQAMRGEESEDQTFLPSAPATVEEPNVAGPGEAMALADEYYTALNSGDLDRAAKLGPTGRDRKTAVAGFGAIFEWECTAETGASVRCRERVTDDFYGPAGLIHEGTIAYRVENGKLFGTGEGCFARIGPQGEFLTYVQAFDRWLHANHPNTEGWIWLFSDEPLPNWIDGRPCLMYSVEHDGVGSLIADYVREFVAQSDDYPLGGTDAVAVVEAYYAQIASGNWDVVREAHAGGRLPNPMYLDQAIAFNATFEHECRVVPPRGKAGGATVTRVRCDETMHDDFYEPGGITRRTTMYYNVDGRSLTVHGGLSCWVGEPSQIAGRYIYEFQQWRRGKGLPRIPGMIEILDPTPLSLPCGPYPFSRVPTAKAVELLGKQLAEFVAASPHWPIGE